MNHSILFIINLNKLSESTRIIIMSCFCITKGLYNIKKKINFKINDSQNKHSILKIYLYFKIIHDLP